MPTENSSYDDKPDRNPETQCAHNVFAWIESVRGGQADYLVVVLVEATTHDARKVGWAEREINTVGYILVLIATLVEVNVQRKL